MSELPELRPNQIGVSCKTWGGETGVLKMVDEMLYFTINRDSVAMELYPNKPVIILDKDAARMILLKIAETEKSESLNPDSYRDGKEEESLNESRFPFEMNQESGAYTASAEPGADSNELKDLQNNDQEVEAGKAATLSEHSELSAQPDKDGIFEYD